MMAIHALGTRFLLCRTLRPNGHGAAPLELDVSCLGPLGVISPLAAARNSQLRNSNRFLATIPALHGFAILTLFCPRLGGAGSMTLISCP